ncbi:MAG TPA: hypothetical protein VF881_05010 [Polyangiaceae bacterium]
MHLERCRIDLFQGPVLAPARATGLAGAFAAYAEGVDAIASNAAAVAVRAPYSFKWFDFDLSFGVSFPAAFRNNDFDNDGKTGFTYQNFLFYNFGADAQLGPWAIGFLADFQRYDLRPADRASDPQVNETLGRVHVVIGRSFWGGQVALGAGIRAVTLSIDSSLYGSLTNQLQMDGVAPEAGVLIRPDYEPWRLGATFRAPVDGGAAQSTDTSAVMGAPFVPPAGIFLPWELEVGAAIQVGPRPLNPRWLDPHEQEAHERAQIDQDRAARRAAQEAELRGIANPLRMYDRSRELSYQESFIRRDEDKRLDEAREKLLLERRARYANWPRERITVMMELLVSGRSPDALSLESFFSQQAAAMVLMPETFRRSGRSISYSPRLGLEGEPVADRIQTRIGTYIEPSRFGGLARQHFTFGFDVKLLPWGLFGLAPGQIWRIGAVTDLAPRYQNFGISLGAWH